MAIRHIPDGQDFFGPHTRAEHQAFGFTGSAPGRARNHPIDPAGEEDGDTYVERQARRHGGRIRRAKGGAADGASVPGGPQDEANWNAFMQEQARQEALHGRPAVPFPEVEDKTPPQPGTRKGYQLGGMVGGAPSGRPVGAPMPQGDPTGALNRATISMPAGDALRAIGNVARAGKAAGARQAVNAIANEARVRRGMPVPAQTALAATPMPAPAPQGVPAMARGGSLTAAQRHHLPKSDFALPGERYPINDPNHARNALARVSQHGTPSEKARVRAAVHRKYPSIGKD